MKGGFSFCGIDIADIGLEYAPENKDTYVYRPTEFNIHEETFEGHDGGYFYGVTRQPKEFILRCYYEDTHIAKGVLAKAYSLFKVGKSGMLIFQRRPWCYYYATVTSVDQTNMYSYLNGMFVVTMKAYYPLARGLEVNGKLMSNAVGDPYHGEIMMNTAILEKEVMVPPTTFTTIPSNPILLYNPGTERANVSIVLQGQAGSEPGDGVVIENTTINQSCRYVLFNTTGTKEVHTDGISGKTTYDNQLAFLYHDYGFIELEPAYPILRNVYVSYTGSTVTATNILYQEEEEKEWYTGKYIYLNGWYKIASCADKHTLTLETSTGAQTTIHTFRTTIAPMNEINITLTNTTLSKISFIYKPTFA